MTDPAHPPVVIVGAHSGTVSGAFTFCLTRLVAFETCRQGFPPGMIWIRYAADQLVAARNDSVRSFLADYPASPWALFVDADMGFPETTVAHLLDAADATERPVVGGLCFALKRDGAEDYATQSVPLRSCPTVYTWAETDTESGFVAMADYPRDALVPVAATGMALVLVHRTVLEAVRDRYGECWFDRVPRPKGGGNFGEDLSFFVRVAGCGYPVHVDTGLRTSHDKGGVFLTEAHYDREQARPAVPEKVTG